MLAINKSGIKNYAQSLQSLLKLSSLSRMASLSLGVAVGTILGGGIQPAQAEGHMHEQAASSHQPQRLYWLEKKTSKSAPSNAPSTMRTKASTYRVTAEKTLERSHARQSIQPLLGQRPEVQETVSPDSELPNDGIYLYGQQPLPDQLATAYFVFEARAGIILGAFYMPHSSFDCVEGEVQDTQLALTITDSYSQETAEYALGIDHDTQVASTTGLASMAIEGYHRIQQVSDNDLRILETCKAFYSEEI